MSRSVCCTCLRPPIGSESEQCYVLSLRASDAPGRETYKFCTLCFIGVAEEVTRIMNTGGGYSIVHQAIKNVYRLWEEGRKKQQGPKDWNPRKKPVCDASV